MNSIAGLTIKTSEPWSQWPPVVSGGLGLVKCKTCATRGKQTRARPRVELTLTGPAPRLWQQEPTFPLSFLLSAHSSSPSLTQCLTLPRRHNLQLVRDQSTSAVLWQRRVGRHVRGVINLIKVPSEWSGLRLTCSVYKH